MGGRRSCNKNVPCQIGLHCLGANAQSDHICLDMGVPNPPTAEYTWKGVVVKRGMNDTRKEHCELLLLLPRSPRTKKDRREDPPASRLFPPTRKRGAARSLVPTPHCALRWVVCGRGSHVPLTLHTSQLWQADARRPSALVFTGTYRRPAGIPTIYRYIPVPIVRRTHDDAVGDDYFSIFPQSAD
jgi:hypothetical protein